MGHAAKHGDNIVWGTFDLLSADNLVWGTVRDLDGDNLVWGTYGSGDNLVWGTIFGDDNIVWGTDCGGSRNCDNIVWGTAITADNLVWGTAMAADNMVWGTALAGDNLVWGTSGDVDNLVWGTSAEDDNMTWGNSGEDAPLFDDPIAEPASFDQTVFESLFSAPLVTVPVSEENAVTQPSLPPSARWASWEGSNHGKDALSRRGSARRHERCPGGCRGGDDDQRLAAGAAGADRLDGDAA